MSQKTELKLDWCSHEAAKWACEHWHYSKSMPVGKTVKIGVWEQGIYIGCLIYSPGAAGVGRIGPSLGLRTVEVAELQRVALTTHRTEVSKIISISIRFIRRTNPKLRLIVSYADPNENHHGGIYQATNWVYVGKSSKTPIWYNKKGERVHDRNVTVSGWSKYQGKYSRGEKITDCTKVETDGKYKYYMPLDDEMRKQIEPLRQPYPKRASVVEAERPAFQSEDGGVKPDPDAPKQSEVLCADRPS